MANKEMELRLTVKVRFPDGAQHGYGTIQDFGRHVMFNEAELDGMDVENESGENFYFTVTDVTVTGLSDAE